LLGLFSISWVGSFFLMKYQTVNIFRFAGHVGQISITEMINLKGGKVLFWLLVSEASVHGQLAPCLWACGEAEHHGSQDAKRERERKKMGWGANMSLKGTPPPTP
jgi:hypothetical protein